MARRARLDAELVRRSLAKSRQQASEFIEAGRVLVDGQRAMKPASQIDPAQAVVVEDLGDDDPGYVSRGAFKLAGALDALGEDGPPITGRRAMDAGASTGGFTDVLLRRGIEHVLAVDVGYGQLAWSLQTDPRVTVMDRTNIRSLTPEQVQPAPDIVVADLSFISLTVVLPALAQCAAAECDFLLMVKPQFEVGRERLGSGGVVRDPKHRVDAVLTVARAAAALGLATIAVVASPLPGPSGNVEFFTWLRRSQDAKIASAAIETEGRLEAASAAGPAGSAEPSRFAPLTGDTLVAAVERAVAEGPHPELDAKGRRR